MNRTTCQWYTYCARPATTTRLHPVRGRVACCDTCADLRARVDAYVAAYRERYGVAPDRLDDGAVIAL